MNIDIRKKIEKEKQLISIINKGCKIHPKYKIILKPRSKNKDCICNKIWNAKLALRELLYNRF